MAITDPENVVQGSAGRAGKVAATDLLPSDTEQDLWMHAWPEEVLEPDPGLGHLDHLAQWHERQPGDRGVEPHGAQGLTGVEPREPPVVLRDHNEQSI